MSFLYCHGTVTLHFLAERCNFIAISGYCHDISLSLSVRFTVCRDANVL